MDARIACPADVEDQPASLASGFVEQSSGLVITADADRAVYLPADDVTAYRELVALIVRRPMVAGPPLDLAPLESLSLALERPAKSRSARARPRA